MYKVTNQDTYQDAQEEYEAKKIRDMYKIPDMIDLLQEFPSDEVRYDRDLSPFAGMQEMLYCPKCHEKTLFWECDAVSVRFECFNPERDENNKRCGYHDCFRRFPFNELFKSYEDEED